VFPDEATDSDSVQVFMPEDLRKVYDTLQKEEDGSVKIPNPLFAYKFPDKFPDGLKGNSFKVSIPSHLENPRL
jgi:hypothetical protein